MTDVFSKKKRSEIMSRIRSSGTNPEERLYRIVRQILGHRWGIQRNVTALPGQPDVYIPSLRLAIFADGCFYHGCPQHGHNPKSNRAYWVPKLIRNLQRDSSNRRKLRGGQIFVWKFWEHELKGQELWRTYERLERRFAARYPTFFSHL